MYLNTDWSKETFVPLCPRPLVRANVIKTVPSCVARAFRERIPGSTGWLFYYTQGSLEFRGQWYMDGDSKRVPNYLG